VAAARATASAHYAPFVRVRQIAGMAFVRYTEVVGTRRHMFRPEHDILRRILFS
jgi:hypothetical protein